ncbi:MAG TPA: nucleoside hydrolase [Armatimonadota bacterium]|jgi:inosine-uridine nucleoside N-ribohydrolase
MSDSGPWVTLLACAVCLLPAVSAHAAASAPRARFILDTDIGDDIDDAYALALLASRPNIELLGVTTTYGQTRERAEIAAKLLSVMRRPEIPVFAGRRGAAEIRRQYDWARGYKSRSLRAEDAVSFIRRQIERYPGEVTLICIGPLTNIGDLMSRYPQVRSKIARVVIMGGSILQGYGPTDPPAPEWNIRCDPAAARAVFQSGVPLTMAGLEVTTGMRLDSERQKRLFAVGTPTTNALAALTNLWGGGVPVLYDVVAVAHALGHSLCEGEPRCVRIDDDGMTRVVAGPSNVTLLLRPHEPALMDWYIESMRPHV